MTGARLSLRLSAAAAILLGAPFLASCVYAPFDLGLDQLGQVIEATVIDGTTDDKVLMLRVDGEITGRTDGGGFFGGSPPTTSVVRDVLDLARRDEQVKGVLLRVNSPGGGVTASDVIFREIQRFRQETGRPVVAFFLDTAASGGYYIAMATDHIVAAPTCVTGSIGVIAQFPNFTDLGQKIGVQVHTITSGKSKDIGNPFRRMKDSERQLLQGLIDNMYERFVTVVAEGRKPHRRTGRKGITKAVVRKLADGRVYTASQAKKAGLVDEIGYFEDALARVKQLANIGDARVVTYERKALGGNRPTIYSERPAAETYLPMRRGQGGGAGDINLVKIASPLSSRPRGPLLKYEWVPGL